MASWITWKSATNPQYEELVEKATSPLNLPYPESENLALNLEICDLIRSKTVPAKPAMQSLKLRLQSKNGRVIMSGLGLIDTCIKNGGDHFLLEIASKEFVDEMVGLIKAPATVPQVREMAIRLFQQWAIAFEPKKELSFLVEMYKELKDYGIAFPPPPTSLPSHLLTTSTPPTWQDSDSCMRCRTAFTFTNRKHHCRNCGLVFDQACSSKMMPLPALGIMTDVRVCEGCWAKSGKGKLSSSDPNTPPVPSKRTPRSAQNLDADLQRAIALSLAESHPGSSRSGYVPSEPPLSRMNGRKLEGTDEVDEEDEELRMAIEASLREMEKVRPSAPGEDGEPEYKPLPTYDLSAREAETLLTFSQTIDHAVGFGDQDLRRFPHAHALHDQAQMLSGKLVRNIEEKGTKQQMLSEMHDSLMQAVRRYDQLLTEQDAYSQRQHEARQRQIHSQMNYGPYQPQQPMQTSPYGYPQYGYNQQPLYAPPPPIGYEQYQPAPPQAQGMYPSLAPPVRGMTSPAPAHAQYAPPTAPYQEYQQQPSQPWGSPQRQSSMPPMIAPVQPVEMGSNPWQQQAPAAQTYPEQGYQVPTSPIQAPSALQQQAQAPPPIPANHPSSPPVQHASSPPKQESVYQAYAPAEPPVQKQMYSQEPQSYTNGYQVAFPDFPSAPNAPLPEPVKERQPEVKEALLIEL